MKKSTLTAVAVACSLAAFGCTKKDKTGAIQVKGSDTMVNLGGQWATEFMKKHPDIKVAVTGGGSGTGIAAMIDGNCDIAQASRAMKDKEKKQAEEKGRTAHEIQVAIDCLVVAVHPKNPVEKLTISQLSDIFTGKVANWKDVGGKDAPITLCSRERNSGTHVYFLEEIVRKGNSKGSEEYAKTAMMMPSSQAVYDQVASNENAIGYYGLGYLKDQNKAVKVAKDGGAAYGPSVENAVSGKYPVSRPLFMYTNGEPTGNVKTYVDFVLSEEGQKIVAKEDFVPMKTAAPATP